MSDLDKAIRAELKTGYWRLSRQTSTAADKGARVILALLDEHKPYGIYTECGHRHELTEDGGFPDGVIDVDDVGLTCAKGLEYWTCEACCGTSHYGQPERCASDHDHHFYGGGGTYCLVASTIATSLGVSGEDRSEPTPEPQQPRVWVRDSPDNPPRPATGSGITLRNDNGKTWTQRGAQHFAANAGPHGGWGFGGLLDRCTRLTEVVTPEDPA